jgi:inner membrane protein
VDTLTHIVLGACIGEAMLGKKLGKKAMLLGAIAQSIPDIDFIAGFFVSTTHNLLAHRGFTHSIMFAAIFAPLISYSLQKWKPSYKITLKEWLIFWTVQAFIHIFIDAFNNYGVGWFEPFSHYRFSFNSVYVADPFFSVWPAIGFLALLLLRRNSKNRIIWWKFSIVMSSLYLFYSCINKLIINRDIAYAVKAQHIPHKSWFSTPAPLNNWLWFVVSGDERGYYVGYRSVFDKEKSIHFEYFPRNYDTLNFENPNFDKGDLKRLIRFSQGYYTIEKWQDTLVFNDLRFGQIVGWKDPRERFAFHYYLNIPDDNKLVVQRGRFAKWDKNSFKALLNRIKGQ